MKYRAPYPLLTLCGFLILGCSLSSCAIMADPEVYEDSVQLVEEIIKDEEGT